MNAKSTTARWATNVAFFTNGALVGNLLPRYPEMKESFGISEFVFGIVVIMMWIGGVAAAHFPGLILRRWGSARVVGIGSALVGVALFVAAVGVAIGPPGLWLFLPAMVLAGALDATVDTAQNAQGLGVQRALGKPIVSTMHAFWSLGLATGGAAAAGTIAAGVPIAWHMAVSGVVISAMALGCAKWFLPDRPATTEAIENGEVALLKGLPIFLVLLPAIAVAVAGISVEDLGNNWAALFLNTERGLSPEYAGLAVTAVIGAQFVGRMLGDHMITWLGARGAVRTGLLGAAVGTSVLLLAGPLLSGTAEIVVSFVGLAIAGFSSAVTVPVAFAVADAMPGLKPQTGLAVVSWLMRAGSLVMSPLVGLIAGSFGLTIALTLFPLLAFLGLLATTRLPAELEM